MVPRWRTGGSPMRPARWARPGIFCRTRSLAATSAWVVVAPIVMVCLRGETAQLRKVRNIDKMAGPREALPERRDEGLSAGQQLRFGIVAEQVLGLGEAAGPDIGCLIHGFCPPLFGGDRCPVRARGFPDALRAGRHVEPLDTECIGNGIDDGGGRPDRASLPATFYS